MALINADVTNKTGSGVSRGGIYFSPFVQEKPVSVHAVQWLEISACSDLEANNVSIEKGEADIASILPDGLNSALAVTDSNEPSLEGNGVQDHSEDAEVRVSKDAKAYAQEKGISLTEVQKAGLISGAGGRILKSDVRAYEAGQDSNQPEEDHSGASRTGEANAEGGNQGSNTQSDEDTQTGSGDSNADGSADEDGGSQ